MDVDVLSYSYIKEYEPRIVIDVILPITLYFQIGYIFNWTIRK